MLPHLSSGEGEAGDHDRITAVAVVGQTLWMESWAVTLRDLTE